ncbi:RagB/SusD family nutrient uptake outer membrane protein [Pedobacter sp. HMWF019]|uniref:RagB/SusD family nutrient uptake outer membrane protein n=1 Tax=Pedobacter sp. HMWF019 TaxID=2056856 RepID=UPI000D3BE3DE|nr:RagB/SusD family nutrient uptake outer membrane protein [Pedobacter sp. HMWF019]PTT03183.1 RagB/SusD family nutrient uptake outer membrane protein [Pedobacter sp. HMWF019]
MKTIKIKLTVLTALCLVLLLPTSCKKGFFDAVPDNLVTVDGVFQNRAQTEKWLTGLYASIPDPWDMPYNYTSAITCDEMDASNWTNPALNSGAINADANPSGQNAYYEKIRLCTIFLENVDHNEEIKALVNGADLIKQYKGEAQFLRAYYYWLLMKQVGPVVISPLKSATPEDNFQIPRSSWDECVAFVLAQITEAENNLPLNNYITGSTTDLDVTKAGRINKIIVGAVRSQILLYHASPLFNGNTELSDFRNLDGKQLFNQTYNAARWKNAADAAKAAIDLAEANGKSLYKATDANPFKAAFLSCRDLFWNGWKAEGIWLRSSTAISGSWEASAAPRSTQGTAYNGLGVVQSLVDDFRMADGSNINSNAAYKENTYTSTATDYYVAGTNTMYTNREPRFYADVTFNGAVNPGIAKTGANNARVEFFNSGTSGKAGAPRDWPKTGYTARKNIHPTFSMSPSVTVTRPAMLIRLAELYLNYAEALNESDPGNSDVLKYLNLVRSRAGLPALTSDLGQSDLRTQIRLERRIELCYEGGHRFYDVRRWKIPNQAGSNQGGAFYGMNMDAGTSLSDPNFHVRTVAFTRAAWQRKFYFLPYGQNEMDRNKQLVQFPGY